MVNLPAVGLMPHLLFTHLLLKYLHFFFVLCLFFLDTRFPLLRCGCDASFAPLFFFLQSLLQTFLLNFIEVL